MSGPFVVTQIEVDAGGAHGGVGRVVLRRRGWQPQTILMEPEEAEAYRPYLVTKDQLSSFLAFEEGTLDKQLMLNLAPEPLRLGPFVGTSIDLGQTYHGSRGRVGLRRVSTTEERLICEDTVFDVSREEAVKIRDSFIYPWKPTDNAQNSPPLFTLAVEPYDPDAP